MVGDDESESEEGVRLDCRGMFRLLEVKRKKKQRKGKNQLEKEREGDSGHRSNGSFLFRTFQGPFI